MGELDESKYVPPFGDCVPECEANDVDSETRELQHCIARFGNFDIGVDGFTWDWEKSEKTSRHELYEELYMLIWGKLGNSFGIVWMHRHNYGILQSSTSGNFDGCPVIMNRTRFWVVILNNDLPKDLIRVTAIGWSPSVDGCSHW